MIRQKELRTALEAIAGRGPNPSLLTLLQLGECWEKEAGIPHKPLLEALAKLTAQAERAFIGHLLVSGKLLKEEKLIYSLSKTLRIPRFQIARYDINPDAISTVPAELARRNEVFPIDLMGRILTLAVTNPFVKLDALGIPKGFKVRRVLCSREEIRSHFDIYYPIEAPQPASEGDGRDRGLEAVFERWAREQEAPLATGVPEDELEFHTGQRTP